MNIKQAELARRAKVSKTSITDALATDAKQTTVMPQIHKALGWEPPPTTFSPDQFEALALYSDLSDFDRGEMLEKLRQKVEQRKKSGSRRNP